MVAWWRQVIDVLQSASHSDDFYQKATQALVQLVGLDVGAVFILEGMRWVPRAMLAKGTHSSRHSTGVLETVQRTGRPFAQRVATSDDVMSSMASIDAVVAAPILDRSGGVIGALYGHRSRDEATGREPEISHLEVLLVEALASGVATGLSRLEEQRQKLEEQRLKKVQQATFEQFFGRELAAELERDPDMLRGRETDVTVLFCDIRGFSKATDSMEANAAMNWLSDTLSELSGVVLDADGVLVDYVGDELFAMWGAPEEYPSHGYSAVRAAMDMMKLKRKLNERYKGKISFIIDFGIGINTGIARVGNTGSRQKFKYGPMGRTVNLGSRIQGLTKQWKVSTLIAESTAQCVPPDMPKRRLCKAKVVGLDGHVDLFQLMSEDEADATLITMYEEGLALFESGTKFRQAARLFGELVQKYPDDGPALIMLERSVRQLVNPAPDFSSVWEAHSK